MPSVTSTEQPPTRLVSRVWAGRRPGRPARIAPRSGRGRVPYLVLGVLLVVGCVAGGVVLVRQVGEREPMLAVARPVTAGEVLTPRDVRQVPLSADAGVGLVPARRAATVWGRPVAYSLPAGTLLTPAAFGHSRVPPPGQAIVAVAAKPGQFPPDVTPGATVSVITVPDSDTGTFSTQDTGGPWQAVVTGVGAPGGDESRVISLQLSAAGAEEIATVPPGQLSLIALPAGGR